jgi:hypothetical protein
MKIFVGGSLRDVQVDGTLCRQFVEKFAEKIVHREHTLLTGCRGSLDKAIAEAAPPGFIVMDKRKIFATE